MRILLLAAAVAALAGCAGARSAGGARDDAFPTDPTGLASATSTELVSLADGDIYRLVATPVAKSVGGSTLRMLAYNGSIPGPTLVVPRGATIHVDLVNQTDTPTTLHSHGVRMDNAFDGVPDHTQEPIPVGGTFRYTLHFPDAGVYWYHPHVRADYAQELGLYGSFLVTDPGAPVVVNRELSVMVDDILLADGKVAYFDRGRTTHAFMGRFGNTFLVNGETGWTLDATEGEVLRLYLTNAANTRTFNLSVPGARLKQVGGDNGSYERETWVDSVILGPSERGIVDMLVPAAGSYPLVHSTPERTYEIGSLRVSAGSPAVSYVSRFETLEPSPATVEEIDRYRPDFTRPVDKSVALTISMKEADGGGHGMHRMPDGSMMANSAMAGMSGGVHPIEWEDEMGLGNAQSDDGMVVWQIVDRATSQPVADMDWMFRVGDRVRVSIYNDPGSMHPMQHPIHIHGQRFLVISVNGVQQENFVWKDTVLIRTGDTVDILLDASNPGTWMVHCHISEHLESGMMMSFVVES